MPHRCSFGCKNITGIVLHTFPNPEKFPDRFQVWVNLVGGKLETELDYEFYKKKKIYDSHFTDEHRNRFKRLNALAVPTLNLPSISDNITAGVHVLDTTREHECVTATIVVPQVLDPSTSGNCSSVTPIAMANILVEHNYSALNCHSSRKSVTVSSGRSYCTCTKRHQNKKIRMLHKEVSRLRKKGQAFKQRVASAEKLSQNVAFQQTLQCMTKPAQLFVHMQKQTGKHPKGRRFNIEEKILCLSLYKKSPSPTSFCINILHSLQIKP